MFKSFSALAFFTLLGASVIAVEASEAAGLAKGDRLQVRAPLLNCATQIWPYIAATVWDNRRRHKILEVRLVAARR